MSSGSLSIEWAGIPLGEKFWEAIHRDFPVRFLRLVTAYDGKCKLLHGERTHSDDDQGCHRLKNQSINTYARVEARFAGTGSPGEFCIPRERLLLLGSDRGAWALGLHVKVCCTVQRPIEKDGVVMRGSADSYLNYGENIWDV